jgi:hypothetical protein
MSFGNTNNIILKLRLRLLDNRHCYPASMTDISTSVTAASQQAFHYTPLYETDAIRLAILHPSQDRNSAISCALLQTTLESYDTDTINHYTALSYVWGDPSDQVDILVNNKRSNVTRNQWHALRDIRDGLQDRAMWIDAICINQADQKEKSIQVMQM